MPTSCTCTRITPILFFVQRPGNCMPFRQLTMYVLQCPHDADVNLLYCFAILTNYHTCIAMATCRCRCAPPILLWPWPLYDLFPTLCLTFIYFVDLHWSIPLCMQRPEKPSYFNQLVDSSFKQCAQERHTTSMCVKTFLQNAMVKQCRIIWGCSSAVERSLCMWKVPGSIPGISTRFF